MQSELGTSLISYGRSGRVNLNKFSVLVLYQSLAKAYYADWLARLNQAILDKLGKILMKLPSVSLPLGVLIALAAFSTVAAEPQLSRTETQRKITDAILKKSRNPAEAQAELCVSGKFIELAYLREGVTAMAESQLNKRINALMESREVGEAVVVHCASRIVPVKDLDQLRVDSDDLDGKRVIVRGQGQYIMGSFFMKKDAGDMNPIAIDMAQVSRGQRLDVIQRCGDVRRLCEVTVAGIVGKVSFQLGVVANTIMVK